MGLVLVPIISSKCIGFTKRHEHQTRKCPAFKFKTNADWNIKHAYLGQLTFETRPTGFCHGIRLDLNSFNFQLFLSLVTEYAPESDARQQTIKSISICGPSSTNKGAHDSSDLASV